uniref:Uncharacterized protein n=1 Tax=Daphnia galeata TaxID=27404 RepID=A0A8J2RXV0_9CRUS|nr:unnamed protein product [Daphnia galeata]
MDPIGIASKLFGASIAASTRVVKSVSSPFKSLSSVPSINAEVEKLQECPEIFDMTPREAKFAIRATDLGSWQTSSSSSRSSSRSGQGSTNSDPKAIQHWALVVYFQEGKVINFFEAGKDENGQLQAGRAQIAFKDIEIFNEADQIVATAVTSPRQLLEIAKQVKTGEYSAVFNNCQTWLKKFLNRINSDCGSCLSLPFKYLIGTTN